MTTSDGFRQTCSSVHQLISKLFKALACFSILMLFFEAHSADTHAFIRRDSKLFSICFHRLLPTVILSTFTALA